MSQVCLSAAVPPYHPGNRRGVETGVQAHPLYSLSLEPLFPAPPFSRARGRVQSPLSSCVDEAPP